MAEPERDNAKLPITGVLVLATIIGGILWYQAPLKSARPVSPGMEKPVGAQMVLARLWQDPIGAADEHADLELSKGLDSKHHEIDHLAGQIAGQIGTSMTGDVTVLLLITDGSPYAEGTESRIRHRYAVGAALGVACFIPQDQEHIGYFDWESRDRGLTLRVPYEWYKPRQFSQCQEQALSEPPRSEGHSRKVLVLWVSEDALSDAMLGDLSQLARDLNKKVQAKVSRTDDPGAAGAPRGGLKFKIIGPAGSTALRDMLEETRNPEQITWPTGSIELYSPWATAGSELLLPEMDLQETNFDERVKTELQKAHVELRHRVGSDYELARALVEELGQRGVEIRSDAEIAGSGVNPIRNLLHLPLPTRDPIALIAEWDTFYGRTLPLEFTVAACIRAEVDKPDGKCDEHAKALDLLSHPKKLKSLAGWVHRYSYLRGLDGELPNEGTAKQDNGKKTGKGKSKDEDKNRLMDLEELERPEGRSQLDYLRRLVERMEADARSLGGGGQEFRAIGIIGSDVYDKLLILQALRKRFPRATFFTTDLDARLLHPSQYEWTRNLIIASPYGLQLHTDIQRMIPPFRDSYQTSVFYSVLRALGQIVGEPGSQPEVYTVEGSDDKFTTHPGPRLYEVGLSRPVDLTNAWPNSAGEVQSIHGQAVGFLPWYKHAEVGWSMAAVGLFCLLLAPFNPRLAKTVFLFAGVFLVVLWFCWRLSYPRQPGGEPFYWFEGVSLWPTELLRLLAAGLSGYFLWIACRDLRENQDEVTKEFLLDGEGTVPARDAPVTPPPGRREWIGLRHWAIHYEYTHAAATSLWQEHLQRTRYRWSRIVPQVVIFGLLGASLFGLFGFFGRPYIPFRGNVSAWVDTVVMGAGVVALLLLIFFVVDAMRLFRAFIRRMTEGSTGWPAVLLVKQAMIRSPKCVSDWLDIRLIAKRTAVVSRLIYYPFIVLSLMIVARLRVFDNWDFPPPLLLIWGLSAGWAILSAILLSRAAEDARRAAIQSLRDTRYKLLQERGSGWEEEAKQVDLTIEEIQSEREGAFADWTQHPVLKAILFPSGGIGLVAVLNYLL